MVQLTIFDILGRTIRKFKVGDKTTGIHSIMWDGKNNVGQKVVNGIYFYRLETSGEAQVKKLVYNNAANSLVPIQVNYSFTNSERVGAIKKRNEGDNYTVLIENSESTLPFIHTKRIENVTIESNTTLNFTVEHIAVTTIEYEETKQIIKGFGGANILLWRADMTAGEIERAFGTGDGQLGFSILRIMVEADSNRWSVYLPTAEKAYNMGATIIGFSLVCSCRPE